MNYLGNVKLLKNKQVYLGVFASQTINAQNDYMLENWVLEQVKKRKCFVGTFHSDAEIEILQLCLANGGNAIWFRGCSLPKKMNIICDKAIKENRLLVFSCFKRKHHSISTARYCAHLVSMYTREQFYWIHYKSEFLEPIYKKAIKNNKKVKIFKD